MRGFSTDFKSVTTSPAKDKVMVESPQPVDVKPPVVEKPIKVPGSSALPQIGQISGLVRAKNGPRADAGEIRSEEGYYWIRVDQAVPYPGQPRKSFPDDEMAIFTAGIKEKGQLKPCLVKRVEHQVGVLYQIIGGERRWKAARDLHWSHIKAVFTTPADDYEQFEEAVIDNCGGIEPPPLDVSDSIAKLWDSPKYKDLSDTAKLEALSLIFCKSVGYISYHRPLIKLCPEVRYRLETVTDKKERIGVLMGAFIAGVSDSDEQAHLADTAVRYKLSLEQLKEYARKRAKNKGYDLGTRPRRPSDDYEQLRTLFRRFDERLALLLEMDVQRVKEMFKRRTPAERMELMEVIRRNGNRLIAIRDILKEFNDGQRER